MKTWKRHEQLTLHSLPVELPVLVEEEGYHPVSQGVRSLDEDLIDLTAVQGDQVEGSRGAQHTQLVTPLAQPDYLLQAKWHHSTEG